MGKLFINRKLFALTETESTNTYASSLPDDTPEGSVVWALSQSRGRGQGENKWESEDGKNLLLSIVLNPVFIEPAQQFYISKAVSLAVADLISLYTDKVSVKWPNDVYVGDKKIAGILIENSLEMDFIKQSVVGIGVNINQTYFLSNAPNPVSLKQLTGQEFYLDEELDTLCQLLEYRYDLLKNNQLKIIDETYFDLLYRKNKPATYRANGKTFRGTITGVGTTGQLHITNESGNVRKFWHKEVEFVIG